MENTPVRLGIIIQARMGSSRLPGKVLELISGRTLLDHILLRLSHLKRLGVIVIATSDEARDDPIANFCSKQGVECFRGSEFDVLERYFRCALFYHFEQIVRLTADNPFTDVEELDRLIDLHLAGNYDFSASFKSLPIGVGAEVMKFSVLELSHLKGYAPHHREHVDEYVLDNQQCFRIGQLNVPKVKHRPDIRLTVDTMEDLRRARFIAEHASEDIVGTEEAIGLCSRFA